jgi:predicted peptidase
MDIVLDLMDDFIASNPVDPDRVYVTGPSMGGFGTWDAIQRRPERFAAAVPVCGGGDATLAKQIARVPVWAFHGARDPVVNPKRSRDMIAALKAAGAKPRYTEYENVAHSAWIPAYADDEMFKWLFSQRRSGSR